jgi:long-chain acyl-CoA synthetase
MVLSLLRNARDRYPDRTALVYDSTRISYGQLYEMSTALSSGMAEIGLQPTTCIALLLPNSIEFVQSFFAAAGAQCVILPINPLLSQEEIRHYLADADARAIITNSQLAPTCQAIIAALDPTIKLIVTEGSVLATHTFAELAQRAPVVGAPCAPYGGAMLYQYSSGSTGRPKRVPRTQEQLVSEASNFLATAQLTADDAILCMVPLFHAHGLGNCMLAMAASAAKLVILEQATEDGLPVQVPFLARCPRVLQLIADEQVTILPGVPYIFSALAETSSQASFDLASLRLCFSAGNSLPRKTFDAFLARFDVPIRQLYGCTEAGSVTLNLDHDISASALSAGHPLHNVHLQVVDEQGQPLPAGQTGEILFTSPALTSGYAGNAQLNEQAFRDGYFYTGDLGQIDAAGRLYITGRKKLFIDTGGYKVDSLEVEDVLHGHDLVDEAVVVGVEDTLGSERVQAFVVTKHTCAEETLLAYCRARLADYKVPRSVIFVDDIPKSPLGKILRKDLLRVYETIQSGQRRTRELGAALQNARSPLQRRQVLGQYVQEQLCHILHLHQHDLDPYRPLNELGLNSITAMELTSTLADALGVKFSATLIWNHPTIAELADYLASPPEDAGHAESVPASQAFVVPAGDTDIDQLSDAEVRRLLAYETERALQHLEQLER